MKRIKLLFVASISILALFACKKDALLVNVNLSGLSASFKINKSTNAGDTLYVISQNINLDSVAKTKNTSASLLKEYKVSNLRFNIVDTATGLNFNALESGSVTIFKNNNKDSIVYANFSTSNINPSSKQFDVIPLDVDILPYFKQSLTTFKFRVKTKSAVPKGYTIKMTITEGVAKVGA